MVTYEESGDDVRESGDIKVIDNVQEVVSEVHSCSTIFDLFTQSTLSKILLFLRCKWSTYSFFNFRAIIM